MNSADTSSPSQRGPAAKWALGSAVVAFVATRLAILLALTPFLTDVHLYFAYAVNTVDLGLTPYKTVGIEYPPAAYWVIAAPRIVAGARLTREQLAGAEVPEVQAALASYHRAFRWQMLLAETGAFAFFLLTAARRWPGREAWAAWGYLLATTPLAHLLFDRLDAGMLLMLMGFAYAWTRGGEPTERAGSWRRIACMALGLSVAYKLVSLVAAPFVLLALWRDSARRADALGGALALGGAAALPFLVHWPSAGAESLAFLKYHGERGIEIESLYASALMLLRPLGVNVQAVLSHGGTEVQGDFVAILVAASTCILLVVLAALGGWSLLHDGERGGASALRCGCLAILLTVVLSKVLSPQYLVFALPLWLVVGLDVLRTNRQVALLIALAATVACLTTWVFPYHWAAEYRVDGRTFINDVYLVPDMQWAPVMVLAARNLLLMVGTGWLAVESLRGGTAAAEPAHRAPK